MIWLLVAAFLCRVQMLFAPSFRSPYCGMGTVDNVNRRQALSPMAYRVLVPWIIGLTERLWPRLHAHRLTALYLPLQIALLTLALAATAAALGDRSALLLAALLPATFYFDYWDWAVELAALALALTGQIEYAVIGGLLAGLSRETAPLVAVTYILVTGDVGRGLQLLGGILAVMLAVRLWVGKKRLYCARWMWRINMRDVRALLTNRPFYLSEIAVSLLITVLCIARVVTGYAGEAWPVPLVLLAAGWLMARAAETRVFAPCLLWIVMGV